MKKSAVLAAFAASIFFVGASGAEASTIYQDSFTRTGALNGSSPDIDTTGATWASGSSSTDGSVATSTSSQSFLSFTFTSGFVYTLSVDITASSGAWAAFGFAQSTDTSSNAWNNGTNNPDAWMLLRPASDGSPNDIQGFGGPNTNDPKGSLGVGTQGGTYSITLDTTAPTWTYSYAGPGITPTVFSFATNPTAINSVGIGTANGATGKFDNFKLTTTQAVPEPSTYGLILGGLTLLLVNRRSFIRV